MRGFRLFVRAVEVLTLACLLVAIGLLAYRPTPHATKASAAAAGPVDGEKVFSQNCNSCHGPHGEGGFAPKLTGGAVVSRFPNPADERAVIEDGRGGMPAWGRVLTPAEIDAVVAYTRR